MGKWLKKYWLAVIPIIISIIALSVYISTCVQTESHSIHNEIYNKLERLDNRIERYDNLSAELDRSDIGLEAALQEAKELRDKAEIAWSNDNYSEADIFIEEAHNILPQETEAWLWLVLLAISIVGIIILILIGRFMSKYVTQSYSLIP